MPATKLKLAPCASATINGEKDEQSGGLIAQMSLRVMPGFPWRAMAPATNFVAVKCRLSTAAACMIFVPDFTVSHLAADKPRSACLPL